MFNLQSKSLRTIFYFYQGCALAEPGGPWRLTFSLRQQEHLSFFIQIICWAPWILQFQDTGLPSILLRAQPGLLQDIIEFTGEKF